MKCRIFQILISILAVFIVTAIFFSHKKESRYKSISASAESNNPLRYEAGDCIEIQVRPEYAANPERYESLVNFDIQPGYYEIKSVTDSHYEAFFFNLGNVTNPAEKKLSFVLLDLLNSPTKIKSHIDCKIMEQIVMSGNKN